MPTDLKERLLAELCALSVTKSSPGRDSLLDGIPRADTLTRDPNIQRLDLNLIIMQLAQRGRLANGEMAVVRLIDNALPYAEGYEIETRLKEIRTELMAPRIFVSAEERPGNKGGGTSGDAPNSVFNDGKDWAVRDGVNQLESPIRMEFVRVPPGEVPEVEGEKNGQKGCVVGSGQRDIIPEFYISRDPITITQYQTYILLARRETGGEQNQEIPQPVADCPMVCVTFEDAKGFCKWLSGKVGRECRLPTEEQWLRAAEVMKMGNSVWEWCSNEWQQSDRHISDDRQKHARRVLRRGGPALSGPGSARRWHFCEIAMHREVGFRVVVPTCQTVDER